MTEFFDAHRPATAFDHDSTLVVAMELSGIGRSASCRLSIWAACKPNHVDGRDKPGHDGKWQWKSGLYQFVSRDRSHAPPPALGM